MFIGFLISIRDCMSINYLLKALSIYDGVCVVMKIINLRR